MRRAISPSRKAWATSAYPCRIIPACCCRMSTSLPPESPGFWTQGWSVGATWRKVRPVRHGRGRGKVPGDGTAGLRVRNQALSRKTAGSKGSFMNFALREKHLESERRRSELLAIEKRLVDHPFPPQLVIENTSICNMECIHCSHRELKRVKRHMARPLWDKIVEEVGREHPKCEIWPTCYGEALIMAYKNELWERLDYADKVGCKNLVLNSNGTLLERWDNIDKILNSPLKRFILSLDGLSKEVFEKIRFKG